MKGDNNEDVPTVQTTNIKTQTQPDTKDMNNEYKYSEHKELMEEDNIAYYEYFQEFEDPSKHSRGQNTKQPENQILYGDSTQVNEQISCEDKQLVCITQTRKNMDMKYQCDQCQFRTTKPCYLNEHKLNIHGGLKYPCDQCQYHATRPSCL